MSRLFFAVASLIALAAGAACSAPGAARTGQTATGTAEARAESGTRLVCDYEKPTGSNIPVRTCYRVLDDQQRDHARDMTIDALNKPHAQMKGGQ